MNTGREIETKRLKLLPGVNKRDSKPFLKMLREDGNFEEFCGAKFSEKNLSEFATYFERGKYIGTAMLLGGELVLHYFLFDTCDLSFA